MRVQVLVKHYLYEDLTNACMDSLEKQEIISNSIDWLKYTVIDSTPDSTYKYKNIEIEKIDNSVGLIESFNKFLDTSADMWICLNNDVYAHKYFVDQMAKALATDNIGICAPMYDQPGGGILEMLCPYKPADTEWSDWIDKHLPYRYIDTKHVDNCAWGFNKKLVETIGLPDGNFPGAGWGANLDYCYRARKAGFKVVANMCTFVHHNHRGTYGKLDKDYAKHSEEQRDSYLIKKYGNKDEVW